jgi:3'-phosphoadenosine 5'-phosphosulfate sulfotransferase (PAPS reductase)/FAD synthetase
LDYARLPKGHFLYDGNPLSFWEYSFVKIQLRSPYSVDIQEAWNFLKSKASVEQTTEGYSKLTKKGRAEIAFYLTLHEFKPRVKYLDTACKSLSLIPVGYIKRAIHNEPVLKAARTSKSRKFLLHESSPATQALRMQFESLKEALKDEDYKDLLIPAVVWIEALNKQEQYQIAI